MLPRVQTGADSGAPRPSASLKKTNVTNIINLLMALGFMTFGCESTVSAHPSSGDEY